MRSTHHSEDVPDARGRSQEETRELILRTAEAQVRRFGAEKVAVVDIARACQMSHGNVYRFFPNRAAILNAIARHWLEETEFHVRRAVAGDGLPPEQLETFVLELHRVKRRKLLDDPEIYRTYSILRESPAVVGHHLDMLQEMVESILLAGNEAGDWSIADVPAAALAFRQATIQFHHPLLVAEGLDQDMEPQLHALVALLISAFRGEA